MTYGSFGDLLRLYIARKHGLTQTRLAHLIGYDQAVLTRMGQGKKDLTGPSGRERVVQIIGALQDEGVLTTQAEANALLKAGGMAPLYDGQPIEAALLRALKSGQSALPTSVAPEPQPKQTTNLPAQLSSFIGREREMAEVAALIATNRLLTLTGSGGCGKTRLALEVGLSLVRAIQRPLDRSRQEPAGVASPTSAFPDGVWLAPLAPLSDPALVADALATTLGLRAANRPALDLVTDYLVDKQMLLLLDNCEHLIQACAEIAETLLRACPDLHILATSREPLNIPGEVTWRVPSLAAEEAVQLFVERARAAKPEFEVTPASTEPVAQICRRLEDMPLAIELAAARVRAFSVQQIASRLDDAFHTLTGGSRTALPRQQTLQATIDWSYDLLDRAEQTLLRELSVFVGGWTLEGAEAIHGTGTFELLNQLVNKSLVTAEDHPSGTRYRMLETIRQYAHAKLTGADEEERAHRLHLAYYTGLSKKADLRPAAGLEVRMWGELLTAETDNALAALGWAAGHGDWQAVIEGTTLFLSFLMGHGYANEVRKWIDVAILSNPQASDTAKVRGLFHMGGTLTGMGDMAGSVDWYRRASALAHQLEDERWTLNADRQLGYVTPDYAEATALLNQVIQRARQTGWKYWKNPEDGPSVHLGHRMGMHGDYEQATALLEKCVASIRETGDKDFLAYALWRLGQVLLWRADYVRARAVLEESVALFRESLTNRPEPLVDLGTTGIYMGDYGLAREAFKEFFPHLYSNNNLERIAQGLVLAAGLAQALGKLAEAARLLGATAAIRRDHHTHGVFERDLFAEYDRRLPAVRAGMDPAEFERDWAEGQRLTIQEAIAEAQAV